MKLLCFGDSNTWGYNPKDGSQFAHPWPAALKDLRPSDEIAVDALCGRTTRGGSPFITDSDGEKTFFRKYMDTDFRSDGLLLMIGSNDLSVLFPSRSVEEIADIQRGWIRAFRQKMAGIKTTVLVIAPVQLNEHCLTHPVFGEFFDRSSLEKSSRLSDALCQMSRKENVLFLDANTVASASDIDGLHMRESDHIRVAEAIDQILQKEIEHPE